VFSRKLNYKSLPNIRDLGGMRTADGRQIKYGSMDGLIREGLGLSDRDREELKEMYLL
jgi:hypothetical protein